MVPMSTADLMEAYCRVTGQYAMLISLPEAEFYECFRLKKGWDHEAFFNHLVQAAPYLLEDFEKDVMGGIMSDNIGVLLFETEEEMELYYRRTVGDDGALDKRCNKYDGPVRVFAMTCGPEGTRNENT